MDTVNNWKRILLQWIKECNFLEKPYYNIEQSEIESFFIKFKDQIKGDVCKNRNLSSFLKDHYPLFEPHFDDENALSSSDYVYVYSLLLHFSCVKCPDEYFQKKCQKLNESAQQNITTFFKKLLEAQSLTKETLRHAIASIALFPPPNSRLTCIESPMKTPRKTEISPPTPRSHMLQERNRELHNLKVQLENELYEKGNLEIEVKRNQEKLLKLSRELKKSHQEIQDLKNDILSRNIEGDSEMRHSEEELLNRRLCKQISQKDVEIAKQREEIDNLAEQKDILDEKLNHAERQMKLFQAKIEELALKIDDLTGELEQKDLTIQYLSEAKLELEQYITEVRSSSLSSRPDLNISVECLDLSRTTNSSGSISSPENLGCSVVDIQLREKENENVKLREEIAAIHLDNAKLSKHMSDLTARYSKLFDICNENLIIDQGSVDPVENFMVFSNCVENFIHKYEQKCIAFNELKENCKTMEEQTHMLSSKIGEIESEVVCLKKEIINLQSINRTLEMTKTSLENTISEMENKFEMSLRKRLELEQSFENLQKELESVKKAKQDAGRAYEQQIQKLKIHLENNEKKFTEFEKDLELRDNALKSMEGELIENRMRNKALESQIEQINDDYEYKKNKMIIEYETETKLFENKLKDLTKTLLENGERFQQFELEKQDNENKILHLQSQYDQLGKELLEKLNVGEYQLLEKNDIIDDLKKEKNRLATELDETKQKCDYVMKEKCCLLKDAGKNKELIFSLKNALEENEKLIQKLTDDHNRQCTMTLTLQTDKEALISSIQEKIDGLRIAIDEREGCLKENLCKRNEQNSEVRKKLSHAEAELKVCKKEFDDIFSKYKDLKEDFANQAGDFNNVIEELKTRLKAIESIDIKSAPTNFVDNVLLFEVSSHSTDAVNHLKHYLNKLIQKLQEVTLISANNEEEIANLSESMCKLIKRRDELEQKLVVSDQRILTIVAEHESELQCEKNKFTNEVKRLNDDICNLESVCDRLTDENLSLHMKLPELERTADNLTKENKLLKVKTSNLEAERVNQLSMAEKLINTETELRAQISNMQSSVKKLEVDIEAVQKLLLVKSRDAEILLEERQKAESTIKLMKTQISELQSNILVLEFESKQENEEYKAANKKGQENIEEHSRKLGALKDQLENESLEKRRIKQELDQAIINLNEVKNQKIVLENKCQHMELQAEELKKNLESTTAELIRLQSEETKLLNEVKHINEAKFSSEIQAEKYHKDMIEQKENVSRLIKEVASIRKEKNAIEEEKNILTKHFEENVNIHMSLDSNYKTIVAKLQIAEKDLLSKENLLKSEQLKREDLENQFAKLQLENMKLKETSENNMKRMEKQALKLGETQAKLQRIKKEAEVAQNSFDVLKSSTESTQRENNKLNMECKSLKEKLSKCERAYDQLESKLQILEKENEVLRTEKENIESSEKELKSANALLEKNKASLEDKVRKFAQTLNGLNVATSRLEQDKVELNLEVGRLNTQLQDTKSVLNMKLKEIQDIAMNFIEVKNKNCGLMELNEKLQVEANEIREENSRLNDELSKLSLRLNITHQGHESTRSELENLREDIDATKNERDAIEKKHLTTMERLKEIEVLVENRQSKEAELVEKIKLLEIQLAKISTEFRNLEEIRKDEKLTNERLNTDISILQAKLHKSRSICEENEKKWREEKEQLLIEVKASDERIKETRLELEGKLEKMKNKMKTLYNDEITKMKKKQEREVAVMKSEFDALKAQNEKYEEHTKKLSGQIFRLNENILEHQKQNTFLKTKLKDLEAKPRQVNRIATSHIPQSTAHQALGSNLHMEDEEGEIFNNTYLSDLKNGRMSELFSRDVCAQELQYRNSLLPPHLKSTYLAQFDHQMGEDEIRETPSLDDSLSTLLNTGQRKKVSGATSYKRPGPPTPSKNAGRLSFGGNGELNREILKETHETGNAPSSSKTPAKFKLFSSRLSMKDENTPPNKRRLSNLFKKK